MTRPADGLEGTSQLEARHSFPCDRCGAKLSWEPHLSALACEYCGNQVAVPELNVVQGIAEYSLEDAGRAARGLGVASKRVGCENCGAVVNLGEADTVGACVFCGSSHVLDQEENRNLIRPESLIPLEIGRESVEQSFRDWIGSRRFRPSALKRLERFQAIGVYVPYWSFDADVRSSWTADSGTYYWVDEEYWTTDAQGRRQRATRRVRRVDWEPAAGRRADAYRDHWVHASKGFSRGLAERLGAFDPAGLVPYRPEYLAGWRAEEYSIDLEHGWASAQDELVAMQRRRCAGDVPGDTHRRLRVDNRFSDVRWKHTLLPIWSLAYEFRGKTYPVLIHGQTGRVAGEAPLSWLKILALVLFIAAVIAAVALVSQGA